LIVTPQRAGRIHLGDQSTAAIRGIEDLFRKLIGYSIADKIEVVGLPFSAVMNEAR
jgi:hypothetical protein